MAKTTKEFIEIGNNIRRFREKKGWSQDTLAEKCNISKQTLHRYEYGSGGDMGATRLRRIAIALDVSVDDLLPHTVGRDSSERENKTKDSADDEEPPEHCNEVKMQIIMMVEALSEQDQGLIAEIMHRFLIGHY